MSQFLVLLVSLSAATSFLVLRAAEAREKLINKIHFRKLIPLPKDGSAVLSCGSLKNHNQCVSSDRCGWCRGQAKCLPLSATSCRSGWYQRDPLQTLDADKPAPPEAPSCRPVPPPAAATSVYSPAGNLDLEKIVGKKGYRKIRRILGRLVPGAVRDVLVDAFIISKWQDYQPHLKKEYKKLGLPPPPANFRKMISASAADLGTAEKHTRYYLAGAMHARRGVHAFVGRIPFVRVTLPDRVPDFLQRTAAGEILGSDHLVRNRWNVQFKAYPAERVELLTPARRNGRRFGAIAIYLAYRRKNDRLPSYYMLEGGTAQGGSRVLYVAPNMKPIYRVASYAPTHLSSSKNLYRGELVMDGDEVKRLQIEVFGGDPRTDKAARSHLQVTVSFERVKASDPRLRRTGIEMFREAVVRIAAISKALGIKMKDLGALHGLFAREGRETVDWLTKPH